MSALQTVTFDVECLRPIRDPEMPVLIVHWSCMAGFAISAKARTLSSGSSVTERFFSQSSDKRCFVRYTPVQLAPQSTSLYRNSVENPSIA